MLEYPRDRPKVFAVKVTRQLMKMCAAAYIGPVGFALVNAVAATEDRAGYLRAVTFYDSQLMMILGIRKQHELAAARTKAVKAGWLQYAHGTKGRPGVYFVTIPIDANTDDDGASDEGGEDVVNESQTNHERITNESQTKVERNVNESQTNLQPSSPMPLPEPVPSPVPRVRRVASQTWLTPYGEVWQAAFGGEMAFGKFAKPLKNLQDTHGEPEVLERWRRYCESNTGKGEFASAQKFSQTFGQWARDAPGTDLFGTLRNYSSGRDEQ